MRSLILGSRAGRAATTVALLILVILIWHFSVIWFEISPYLLPGPLAVGAAVVQLLSEPATWGDIGITTTETLLGFLIAVVVGVIGGVLLGKFRTLEAILNPFIVASQVIPKVALAPLFIVWLGFGIESKVLIAASLAFFPILINTILGIKSIDEGHRQVMTVLQAPRWARFWLLEVRSTLPNTLTGMEMGIVLALIGAVVGEFVGGTRGLGAQVVITLNSLAVPRLFGVLVLLTVLGFVFYIAIASLKRLLIPWHESANLKVLVEA